MTEAAGGDEPLFVDLDGTLIATDSLHESALASLRKHPLAVLRWPAWIAGGRAHLKAKLAADAPLDAALLPYNEALCEYLRVQRQRGRRIYLATAADARIAQAVADHLGLFDGIIASDGLTNLKGVHKLQAIRRLVGERFAYAGNSAADLPIWSAASAALIVDARAAVESRVRAQGRVETVLPRRPGGLRSLLQALRPHQWVKNALIFVPVLTSFQLIQAQAIAGAALAFVAFCLCASATYVLNDLLDLAVDRAHPRKRLRPFASGRASIPQGLALAALLALAGLALAAANSPALFATVASYMLVTSAYSMHLKHYVLLDAVVLAALYTWRLFAGVVATGIEASVWLLAFSLFIFLSLALLKRCAELVVHESSGSTATRGRDYRVSDLRVLWPLGVALGACSIVVFVLYANAPEVRARYASPMMLWLIAIGLTYWLSRMWLKTSRGEMTDDPIVYALKDHGSRVTVLMIVVTALAAHFLRIG